MTKTKRLQVYNKYGGRCAYCGKKIEYKDMQVDHIVPVRLGGEDTMENMFPACRQCNHYKRARTLKRFRALLSTLHQRIEEIYICRVAKDYGVITIKEWDGVFYFEKILRKESGMGY